jgi:hypothetical protein
VESSPDDSGNIEVISDEELIAAFGDTMFLASAESEAFMQKLLKRQGAPVLVRPEIMDPEHEMPPEIE